jgi:hypothetical protein
VRERMAVRKRVAVRERVPEVVRYCTSVSQNKYSTALDPFPEFAVHLGVYGKKVCPGPPL